MKCVNVLCAVPLVTKTQWVKGVRPEGHRSHGGNSLCCRCYTRMRRYGTLEPRPRNWSNSVPHAALAAREAMLEDYVMIRDDVQNIRQAAQRMGVTFSALDRALYRARKRGDARGNAPLTQVERAFQKGLPLPIVRDAEEAA